MTVVKVSDPENGSVTLKADGSFTYTPNADFVGTDSFTYKASDGNAESNVATVAIEIYENEPIETQAETPWQDNESGKIYLNRSWNYTMGYRFSPVKDGKIVKLT